MWVWSRTNSSSHFTAQLSFSALSLHVAARYSVRTAEGFNLIWFLQVKDVIPRVLSNNTINVHRSQIAVKIIAIKHPRAHTQARLWDAALAVFVSWGYVKIRNEIFIRRNLFLADSDVKRTHVSFNWRESKLFITRRVSRLWSVSAQWEESCRLDWCAASSEQKRRRSCAMVPESNGTLEPTSRTDGTRTGEGLFLQLLSVINDNGRWSFIRPTVGFEHGNPVLWPGKTVGKKLQFNHIYMFVCVKWRLLQLGLTTKEVDWDGFPADTTRNLMIILLILFSVMIIIIITFVMRRVSPQVKP